MLGVRLDPRQVSRLLQYVHLLAKWSRIWNLTAIRDPEDMVARHLLDSLSVASSLMGRSVVDVGTGAGLPGIPLAVADPARRFVLVDANGKKTRFVTHAVGQLGLDNVSIEQMRVEHYRPAQGFGTVLCRAYATLAGLLQSAGHLCAPDGRVVVMKGMRPQEEIDALPGGWRVIAVRRVRVPGLNRERHIVEIGRTIEEAP
ncbi:16S rRNA (guanine(527)-N(7))-methyltransferase RsmG [soil metagenome]